MKFRLISIGRERADDTTPLVNDYLSRISKFIRIESSVLQNERDDKIGAKILDRAKESTILIALDEGGKMFNSQGFAGLVEQWMLKGESDIVFVIGGADGLPSEVKNKADILLSLSLMTFPHRLAKLFLVEQIYRSFCIIRNIPYQK